VGNTSTDEVQLSNLSEQIRAEDSSSPERMAHLQKLSAAIEAGTYRVDATAVSRKIIDESTKLP
jgi:flagellar biosynthesis anti-sigma factor FlgM